MTFANEPALTAAPRLSRGRLVLMSIACGVSVANLIYNQPLLGDFERDFHASASAVGQVATVSQIGYGIGLLFLLPLGDLLERRRLVLILTAATAAVMGATVFSNSLSMLLLLHLLIGVVSMSAQILIPLAVELAPPEERGRTVGMLMTGLLAGILLARTVSGFIGELAGWRSVYGVAAVMMAVLALALARGLPVVAPTLKMPYGRLMGSLWALAKSQPKLRSATAVGALSFAGFSTFWTTIAFLMHDHFNRGSAEAGLFGIVGLIGALGAPLAGRISDRAGPAFIITLGLLVSVLSFAIMGYWVTIPALVVGVLLMDLGAQSVQVAEQAKVIALVPEARSRLNALFMVGRFIGGAMGSALGAFAWSRYGWTGVCGVAVVLTTLALIIHLIASRGESAPVAGDHRAEDFLHSEEAAEGIAG